MSTPGAEDSIGRLEDETADGYQRVSALAVGGAVTGLAAALALAHPLLWIVPGVGLLVSGLALRQIGRGEGELGGRRWALAGLCLSVAFGVAAPVALASDRWWLTSQARPAAEQWLAALAAGRPGAAHQLTLAPEARRPAESDLEEFYRLDRGAGGALRNFVDQPLVHALLVLGGRARAQFVESGPLVHAEGRDEILLAYLVTWTGPGGKQSLVVKMILRRTPDRFSGAFRWQIKDYAGGGRLPSQVD
jgi:hypothetical protein